MCATLWDSVVLEGTRVYYHAYPALKRWATIYRWSHVAPPVLWLQANFLRCRATCVRKPGISICDALKE